MENAKIIGLRVIVMSVILIIGVLAYKRNIITKDGTKQLSALELNIVNPLLIFMSYQNAAFSTDKLKGLLFTFLMSALSFAITIPLASLFKRKGKENWSVERFSCIYSNCGFMGIPLISALYGGEGVLYLTAYITIFNLLAFTHGYMMMKEQTDFSEFKTALKSPTIIASVIGLILYVLNIKLPGVAHPDFPAEIGSALTFIADMNTPLAMLIAGATAAQSDLLKSVRDKKILSTTACKLLIIPAAVIVVMGLLPDSIPPMTKIIVCVACSCPAATTGTMFALLFDKNAKRCSEIFAVTTILSMLTLPIATGFASFMIG